MDGKERRGGNEEEEILELRRGPWTVEEDVMLVNYIATHGEGRWNSLARCAGLKRTGKSCRLRWLNYLRPDLRRGNITLEEQLLILELHCRWGNRWSKIAQHLPGRTDNEIKNYWRTRVQKQAKQLKCDVNSKQFKDTMRYLWMPRLLERIQAASASSSTSTPAPSCGSSASTTTTTIHGYLNSSNIVALQPENSTTLTASSDSFGAQVSPVSDLAADFYNIPVSSRHDQDYFQASQVDYSDSLTSPAAFYNPCLDFQVGIEQNNQWMNVANTSDNLWEAEDIWFLQPQQLMNNN